MKLHISLNVKDVEESIGFYSRMFQTEPVKHIPGGESGTSGYAKFDVIEPPLNLTLNERVVERGGGLSHLGLQVETTEKVSEFRDLWKTAGLLTADELGVTCCYARQDKTWIQDPDGNEWEAFVVLEDVAKMDPAEAGCCDASQVSVPTSIKSSAEKVESCSPGPADASCC